MTAAAETDQDAGQELLAAFIVQQLLLLRHAAFVQRDAARRLADLQAEVLARVRAADLGDITNPTLRQRAADHLMAELSVLMRTAYVDLLGDLQGHLHALAPTVGEYAAITIEEAADVPVMPPTPDELDAQIDGMLVAGASVRAWFEKGAGDLTFRLGRIVADAAGGARPADTHTEVRKAISGGATSSADTIVRTAVAAAGAVAVTAVIRANARSQIGYRWLSILDGRTSELCVGMAGRRWDADQRPVGHRVPFRRPPAHPNCRSSLVPWVVGSRVPREPSLGEFLSNLTDAEREDLVGAKRAQMWMEGKATQAEMLDQSARPISLTTLRRLLGLPPA